MSPTFNKLDLLIISMKCEVTSSSSSAEVNWDFYCSKKDFLSTESMKQNYTHMPCNIEDDGK